MDKKKRNIIIIIVLMFIFLGWALYRIANPRVIDNTSENIQQETSDSLNNDQNSTVGQPLDSSSQVSLDVNITEQEVAQQKLEATVKAMALSFTERIGSYSNQSNFENIKELKPFMTEKMQAWADNFISEQDISVNEEYVGVTTRVLATDVLSFDDTAGQATVEVNTQRIEAKGASRNNTVSFQKARLSMVKVDGKWFIDDLKWL